MSGIDQREEDLQRIRGFRLMDDDFMAKCFEDDIPCTELVLSIVLERSDLKVESVRTQYEIANLQGHSVRLDVFATDGEGKRYNIEIQRADRGAGAKRARYYSSLLDANLLDAGAKYEKLPETYVIFITERDVLGGQLPMYHIDRTIAETGAKFADEAHIIYVNGAYRGDTPLGTLMRDFHCTEADDIQYRVLANRVRYFKETEKGVTVMCKALEDMREATRLEERRSIARKLIQKGRMPLEEIAECAKLPLEEVEKLARTQSA